QLPIGAEDDFVGMVDVVEQKAYNFNNEARYEVPIPADLVEPAREARLAIAEALSDFSEEIMELFLDDKEVPTELMKRVAREATIKLSITPVFCGAAYKNKGVQLILDAVVDYLPSPLDKGAVIGLDVDDPEKTRSRKPSSKEPFSALSFKLIHDPYVGQQTFIRIYSGELKSGMGIMNTTKGKPERVGRILRIHAKEREDISVAGPGEIVALIGMKYTKTGDTLCDPEHPLHLESIHIPPSVVELKILPGSRKDQSKLGEALAKLTSEDPSFKIRYDDETEETVISGMGELHLEIIVDRLKTEFGLEVVVGEPAVAYRETIQTEREANHRYVKQSGGKGQFAHTILRVEPNPGKGYEFVDRIKGGAIPAEFITSVNKGILKTLETGVLAGFPVVDVKVTLLDGSFHAVDSSDMAFQICASMCFKQAFMKGDPQLLEPVMKIEVSTPDDYIGDIVGNLNKRRGRVESMRRHRKGSQKLNGYVPLVEMFGYSNSLRNLSSGRANYSMEFYQYMPVTKAVQEDVLKKLAEKKRAEQGR
ncbi:MAG: elongation factor G, partial [Bacteroidetes bacterium HGW-Bacteroidetes-22]